MVFGTIVICDVQRALCIRDCMTDPAVFQYYPGHGLQLQPLASWGRANAIAGACLAAMRSRTTKDTCRKAILTRSLDRMASLGAPVPYAK